MNAEQALDDFFARWPQQYKVVATAEGGLKFQEAQANWRAVKVAYGEVRNRAAQLAESEKYHKAKHQEWLTAYQSIRCKNVGDYTRMFVRRPRMRPLIRFLLSA